MSDAPFSTIKYSPQDHDFLQYNFGLVDPTAGDGEIQWNEIDSEVQSFYRKLSDEEIRALTRYPLGPTSFSSSSVLAHVARKYIRWEFFNRYNLPQSFDHSLYVETKNFPNPSDRPDHLFTKLTIDHADLKADTALYDAILKGRLKCLSTITLDVFSEFLERHDGDESFEITRAAWDEAFDRWDCEVDPDYTAESTWNEMLTMWQYSEPRWRLLMNDTVLGGVTDGFVRFASNDTTVTSHGIRAFIKDARRHTYARKRNLRSWDQMDIHSEMTWPDHPTRIKMFSQYGVALNLNTEPGAKLIANQNIKDGDLVFDVSEPLFTLEKFHVSVDADNMATKAVAGLGQMATWLLGDFDVAFNNLFAITVFHNRLCFVFDGDDQSGNIYDPIPSDEYLFLDVTDLFKRIMDSLDVSGELSESIINSDGDVRSEIPVRLLQDVISKILKTGIPDTDLGGSLAQFSGVRSELWVNDIEVDMTDEIPESLKTTEDTDENEYTIEYAEITDGSVYADVLWPQEIKIQGNLDLSLGVNGPYVTSFLGDGALNFEVEFLVDSQAGVGYAKLSCPDVWVAALSEHVDGDYGGEIYIAIDPRIFAVIDEDEWTLEALLNALQAQVLLDLRKNNEDYLAATAYFYYQQEDDDYLAVKELVSHYQIAFAEGDKELFGVVHDGQFLAVNLFDHDNRYMSQEFEVSAREIALGGMAKLWATDALVKVYQDMDGTWYFKPQYDTGVLEDDFRIESEDFHGEIVAKPVYGYHGDVVAFDVSVGHLEVNIPHAQLLFRNNKKLEGSTRAIIEDGEWRVKGNNILDLFVIGADWEGEGTLRLTNLDNTFSLVNTETDQRTTIQASRLGTDLRIRLIKFNPLNVAGSLSELIHKGEVEFDSPEFGFKTDISGGFNITDADYPIVAIEVDEDFPDGYEGESDEPNGAQTEEGDDTAQRPPKVPATVLLRQVFGPYVKDMLEANRSVFNFADFELGSDAVVNLADSLDELMIEADHVQIYPGGEYKNGRAAYPLIKGFFSFLKPKIKEGTELHIEDPRRVVAKNGLTFNEFLLNHPVKFLGLRITGLTISEPSDGSSSQNSAKLFIKTAHHRLNPICLLKLLYPCKMRGFYDRVDERLKAKHAEEGKPHYELGKNEVPLDLGDLVIFADELMKSLKWDEKIEKQKEKQYKSFQKKDFKGLPEEDLARLEESLEGFDIGVRSSKRSQAQRLKTRLNSMGRRPQLVDHFPPELVEEIFSGEKKSQVLDIIEEINELRGKPNFQGLSRGKQLRMKRERLSQPGQRETPEQKQEKLRNIKSLNYKLLHLYVKEYVERPQLIDITAMEKLVVNAEITPKEFDVGIIKVDEESSDSFSFDMTYMPGERDETIDKDDETPFLAVKMAHEEGEEIRGVEVDYVNRYVYFNGAFHSMSGIEFYAGGPMSGETAFALEMDGFDVNGFLEAVHMPEGHRLPVFGLLAYEADDSDEDFAKGSNLHVSRDSNHVDAGLTFDEANVGTGDLYFTSRDKKTGEVRDALVDQTATRYRGFEIGVGMDMLYDDNDQMSYAFNNIEVNGELIIEDHGGETPRAYFYTGRNDRGRREYVELKRVASEGVVNVENTNITYAGNILMESEIPSQILEHPALESMKAKGFKFDLDSIEIAGSFVFNLDGLDAGITRLKPGDMDVEFIPTEVKFKGDVGFEWNNNNVIVSDLTVPLQHVDLSLLELPAENEEEEKKIVPVIRDFEVLGGDEIRGSVSAQVDLPVNVGSGLVGFKDADFTLTTDSGISFGMDDSRSPQLQTDGLHARVEDTTRNNSVDLTARSVRLDGQDGDIYDWDLNGEFRELIYGVLYVALSGEHAEFKLKKL